MGYSRGCWQPGCLGSHPLSFSPVPGLDMATLFVSPCAEDVASRQALVVSRFAPCPPRVVPVPDLTPPGPFALPRLPALEDPGGLRVTGATAVTFLLAPPTLRGCGLAQATLVRQWVAYAQADVAPAATAASLPHLGLAALGPQVSLHSVGGAWGWGLGAGGLGFPWKGCGGHESREAGRPDVWILWEESRSLGCT